MHYLKKFVKLITFAIVGIILVIPIVVYPQNSSEFHNKVEELTKTLLDKLAKLEEFPVSEKRVIIIAQLLFEKTGEFIALKHTDANGYVKKLEVIIGEKINNSEAFSIEQMSVEGLKAGPDYIMRGLLELEDSNYRIYYSITDIKTGKILAKANISIPRNLKLSLEQYHVYENKNWGGKDETSIYYIKDAREGSKQKSPTYHQDELQYCDLLEGIIQDAIDNYQEGQYNSSLELFTKASKCQREQRMVVHLGLAQCYKQLDEQDKYKKAKKRVGIIVTDQKNFEVYFAHGSFELNDDVEEILKSIGKHITNSNNCYQLIGHSDISGKEDHNRVLSKNRAISVKIFITFHYPALKKIKKVTGKGSRECKVCDADKLDKSQDRRVEFKVIDCK